MGNTDYQYDVTPEQARTKQIVFTKGLGTASMEDSSQDIEFDLVSEKLFPSLRASGKMEYGEGSKWDDRKYRLNQPHEEEGRLVVPLGLTYFGAYRSDINRSDEENIARQRLGEERHNDKWAFFTRALGVAFIAITKDGVAFIGEKISKDSYNGWLSTAAGMIDYAGEPSTEMVRRQALSELREEYGEDLELVGDSKLVGIASHPIRGDGDVVFVGRIDAPSEYFTSGKWLERRRDNEHQSNLVRVASLGERDRLLGEGSLGERGFPGIVYSTRLGLESLTEEDFKNL